MKNYINNLVGGVVLLSAMTACFPEQEVAPIDTPEDNTVATITPRETYTNVKEGDILYFDITVDKMVRQAIDFDIEFNEDSEGDASDVEVISGTLAAFSKTGTIAVRIIEDHELEIGPETLSFRLNANADPGYNFQLAPTTDNEEVNITIQNYNFTLDWSEGTYQGEDMCEWSVDYDLEAIGVDTEGYNGDGATGACPVEVGNLSALPDGTYNIRVLLYGHGIIDATTKEIIPGVTIPWTVTFYAADGTTTYTVDGSTMSEEYYVIPATETEPARAVRPAVVVATVVVADGTYTVLDAEGNELGTL